MISEAVLSSLRSRPETKERVRRWLKAIGYDTTDWMIAQRCAEPTASELSEKKLNPSIQ
jgi:hypothetical protein